MPGYVDLESGTTGDSLCGCVGFFLMAFVYMILDVALCVAGVLSCVMLLKTSILLMALINQVSWQALALWGAVAGAGIGGLMVLIKLMICIFGGKSYGCCCF